MKKTLIFLVLVLTLLLVVAGCSTSAQSSNSQSGNYYVPAGQGCGFEGSVYEDVSDVAVALPVSHNVF